MGRITWNYHRQGNIRFMESRGNSALPFILTPHLSVLFRYLLLYQEMLSQDAQFNIVCTTDTIDIIMQCLSPYIIKGFFIFRTWLL